MLWHNQAMSLQKIALIDIGSNSMRLEIVAIRGGDFWTVARYKSSARIASGMYPSLLITPEAIERACQALGEFRRRIGLHQAEEVRCVATSAVRDAKNRDEVLQRLSASLSGEVEVLSGEQEGRYSCLGVQNGFDQPDALVFDIGGGSAELIDLRDNRPRKILTLPLGAVRLSEMFFENRGRPTPAEWKKMERFITTTLEESGLFDRPFPALIGVGGTARQLARISQKIRSYPFFPDIHHYEIPAREVARITKRTGRRLTPEQARTFNIGADRADILPAGLAVISTITSLSGAPILTFSHYGLRQGLFMEFYHKANAIEEGPVGRATLRRLTRRYGRIRDSKPLRETLHELLKLLLPASLQSGRLLLLCDMMGTLALLPVFHNPSPNTRELWDLLLHGDLPGLSQRDRLLCGLILCQTEDRTGRAKKKAHPYLRHLTKEDQRLLGLLSPLLGLARDILLSSGGEEAALSYRAPVLRVMPHDLEESDESLSLLSTESREIGLGHPLSVQWFSEPKSRLKD